MTKRIELRSEMPDRAHSPATRFFRGAAPALPKALEPALTHVNAGAACRGVVGWLSAALPGLVVEATSSQLIVSAHGVAPGSVVSVATFVEPNLSKAAALLKKFSLESTSIPRGAWGDGLRRRRDGFFVLVSPDDPERAAEIIATHYGDLLFREALDRVAFDGAAAERATLAAIEAQPWPKLSASVLRRLADRGHCQAAPA